MAFVFGSAVMWSGRTMHTKCLDPKLRTNLPSISEQPPKPTKYTLGMAPGVDTLTPKLDLVYLIVSVNKYQNFSKDKKEEVCRK